MRDALRYLPELEEEDNAHESKLCGQRCTDRYAGSIGIQEGYVATNRARYTFAG
jgi:hypothetical protein